MPSLVENAERLGLPPVEPLVIPPAAMLVADRIGLTMTLTCRDAPEQYEITKAGSPHGYIRVRWGEMSVSYPDAGGEQLYQGPVDGFGGLSNQEREAKLLLALGLISARMLRA